MKKILCVCYGNTCRSPMLQALLARELKNRGVEAVVESAGITGEVGVPANEKAIICMKEKGLDITNHRSRRVFDLNLLSYDNIFCFCISLIVSLGISSEKENIELVVADDPYGEDIKTYRACAEALAREATKIANKLAS